MHGCKHTYVHALYMDIDALNIHTHEPKMQKDSYTIIFILHIHKCRHTHIQTNIHTVRRLCENIYVYIQTYIYIYAKYVLYLCKHIYIYIYIHINRQMQTKRHTCTSTPIYVSMYASIYTYKHICRYMYK